MIKLKNFIIPIGDIAILYVALISTLILRYGLPYFKEPLTSHLKPFSLIFIIWILAFFLADFYKDTNLRIDPSVIQAFILTILISIIASVILFYLFPNFSKLTPKPHLVIFGLLFGILDFGWRFILIKIYISSGWRNRLLFIGDSLTITQIIDLLKINPQIGYDVVAQVKECSSAKSKQDINQIINTFQINTIIIQSCLKKDPEVAKIIYQLLSLGISTIDLVYFYETIFRKLPLEELEEGWFIEKIITHRYLYDIIKRIIDIGLSIFIGIISLPITFIIAILIKSTSRGPIIYRQERIGVNDKPFILFKFRTMRINQSGPLWTTKDDKRLTTLGKVLRRTHLDEIPQLYNILKGDISFIGPRPERRELVELYKQLPYYEIRHIIKPGLTGWAQLNYKPSASLEEAKEKLEYDIYYIKNRSLILDFLILLKTLKYLFISNQYMQS